MQPGRSACVIRRASLLLAFTIIIRQSLSEHGTLDLWIWTTVAVKCLLRSTRSFETSDLSETSSDFQFSEVSVWLLHFSRWCRALPSDLNVYYYDGWIARCITGKPAVPTMAPLTTTCGKITTRPMYRHGSALQKHRVLYCRTSEMLQSDHLIHLWCSHITCDVGWAKLPIRISSWRYFSEFIL